MHDVITTRWIAGQLFGLIALVLCVIGFASKRDDRLFVLLLIANAAFALQFAMLQSWVAAAIALLIVLRIHLVRRFKGNAFAMAIMLAATCGVAIALWAGPRDIWALTAGVLGTYGMFMLAGVAMRWLLAAAAFCWVISNAWIGSFGGTLAESLIFITNIATIIRLHRDRSTT